MHGEGFPLQGEGIQASDQSPHQMGKYTIYVYHNLQILAPKTGYSKIKASGSVIT